MPRDSDGTISDSFVHHPSAQWTANHRGTCSGHTFIRIRDSGDLWQCASPLSSGQVIHYWTPGSDEYTITSATLTSATGAVGIQINGWMFDSRAAAAGQSATDSNSPDISPTTAKALLAIGVVMLALGLAIAISGFILFRKARRGKSIAVGGVAGFQDAYAGQVQQAHDPSMVSPSTPPAWGGTAYGYAMPPQPQPPQELAVASSPPPPSSPVRGFPGPVEGPQGGQALSW